MLVCGYTETEMQAGRQRCTQTGRDRYTNRDHADRDAGWQRQRCRQTEMHTAGTERDAAR